VGFVETSYGQQGDGPAAPIIILFLEVQVKPEALPFFEGLPCLAAAKASIYDQDVGPNPLSFGEQEQCSGNGADKYSPTILL
jgi:hypothetical protein